MIGLLVEVEPHGPVSVNLPIISRSGGAFYLPPPTTLVGALAFAYIKGSGSQYELLKDGKFIYSPAVLLLNEVAYACAGAYFYTYTRMLERVFTIIYQRKTRVEELRRVATGEPIKNEKELRTALRLAFGVASRGAITSDRLLLFYLLRDEKLAKCAHGIVRLGTKESRVTVKRVVVYDDVKSLRTDVDVVKTPFYTPEKCAQFSNGIRVEMPIIDKRNFTELFVPVVDTFIIPRPYSTEPMNVYISRNCTAFRLEEDLYVVVPKDIVEGVGPS